MRLCTAANSWASPAAAFLSQLKHKQSSDVANELRRKPKLLLCLIEWTRHKRTSLFLCRNQSRKNQETVAPSRPISSCSEAFGRVTWSLSFYRDFLVDFDFRAETQSSLWKPLTCRWRSHVFWGRWFSEVPLWNVLCRVFVPPNADAFKDAADGHSHCFVSVFW